MTVLRREWGISDDVEAAFAKAEGTKPTARVPLATAIASISQATKTPAWVLKIADGDVRQTFANGSSVTYPGVAEGR